MWQIHVKIRIKTGEANRDAIKFVFKYVDVVVHI